MIVEKNDDVGGTWLENTLSGLPGRQPEPQLQLLVRAAPRLAAALLDPGRAARLLPRGAPTRSASASTSASAPRCASADVVRRRTGAWTVRVAHGRRPRGDASTRTRSISAVGQLNRPSLPDIDGSRLVRGPVVPLGPVGPRRRPARQAGRGDRHRRERGAVHPRDRAERRRAARVPAHAAVARARPPTTTTRSRRGLRWLLRARAVVQRVEPLLDLLADGRRRARRACASIPTGNRRTQSVERAQRHPAPDARPSTSTQQFADRPDLLDEGRADLPARREAAAARQRRLGRRAEARQRRSSITDADPRDHADGHRHRRRRRARRRRASSTAPASRRRSSSRR